VGKRISSRVIRAGGAVFRRLFILLVPALLLLALLTPSASAVGEQITISPTSGPPGTTVTVNGSGWQDHASRGLDVPIQINGMTLATAHPDANGNFRVQITIPETAAPGSKQRIDAILGNGGSANAWFDVTEPVNSSPGGSPGSGTGSGIDLEVTKIDPLGQRICAGSNVTFRASIRNNGSTKSGFFNIRWIADNSQTFDGGHYSIPAGATDTHDHIWQNLSAGKHQLEFIADFDKQISESDENNNRFTLTFRAVDCSTGSKSEIDYFALGDSVASGHGLDDPPKGAKETCRRAHKAYPWVVSRNLAKRYDTVDTHVLACSGAIVGTPDAAVPKGSPYKLLQNQVDYVIAYLFPDKPTLVSITIGANDFEFANKKKAEQHLWNESDKDFRKWANETAAGVERGLRPEVERLLSQHANVVVVITDYFDPMNKKATDFRAKGVSPLSAEVCYTCRPRWGYAAKLLNDVFLHIRRDSKYPSRLQLTGDSQPKAALPIRERFVGHEAPRPSCGLEPPGNNGTWIQPYPDCIHPNAEGAVQIGKTVNFEASKAGR
jgi:lysophospholipase L1-like esterase